MFMWSFGPPIRAPIWSKVHALTKGVEALRNVLSMKGGELVSF